MSYIAEYLWIDGTKPSAKIRSKAKVIAGNGKTISTAEKISISRDPLKSPEVLLISLIILFNNILNSFIND